MSETFNPIRGKKEYSGTIRLGSERPKPSAGTALVFVKDGKTVEVIQDGHKIAWSILIYDGYDSVYEIDLSSNYLSLQSNSLPSRNSRTKMFDSTVTYSCKVKDPKLIVDEKVTDVGKILTPLLESLMRDMSSRFSVDEQHSAENAIRDTLEIKGLEIANNKGLVIGDITVKLTLNESAISHFGIIESTRDEIIQGKVKHQKNLQDQQDDLELSIRQKLTQELFKRFENLPDHLLEEKVNSFLLNTPVPVREITDGNTTKSEAEKATSDDEDNLNLNNLDDEI